MVQWGFPVNVWDYNLCWFTVATSHITSSTIPNCFSVDTQYNCPCQFFWEIYHTYLGFSEFAKYGESGKFAASVGLRPQTPVIGSRSALAVCVHPTFFDLATPLLRVRGTVLVTARRRSYHHLLSMSGRLRNTWNLASWFSGKSLKFLPPDAWFKG